MKALILVDHGSSVDEANQILKQICFNLRNHPNTGFDIIEYCHMELSEPTIKQAIDTCVRKGAEKIVVHPYFLVPGRHSKSDIPRMVKEASLDHKNLDYKVTEPLGIHEKILEVVIERANQ
ncbi:MAG: hypothetical protein GTO02_05425 [Candidatus Dadabacteria bacterium]|nr:hypothetical protein [Candidatus Dadabacteria bacterium]NIQ13847.1 hypothetical protein [Candidatus Dadabacteria bacterium]